MKTVIIWDSIEGDLKFFVIDRDLRHLHNKYVNSTDVSESEAEEVSSLVYDSNGEKVVQMLEEFPIEAVREGAQVIVCGFIP